MSLKSDDIDNISQHSDDMDDDLEHHRPMSPQLPLSLTTHERHRFAASSASTGNPNTMNINNNNNNDDNVSSHSQQHHHNQHHHHHLPGLTIKSELQRSRSPGQSLSHLGSHNGSTDQMNALSSSEPNDPPTDPEEDVADRRSHSLKGSPQSEEDLDMESDINPMDDLRSPSLLDAKRNLSFPIVPNSMFSHSIMYMSHYIPQMGGGGGGGGSMGVGGGPGGGHLGGQPPHLSPQSMSPAGLSMSSLSNDERRKRNRTFIDPVTEVPKLEQWFAMNTHPSHNLILKYTEDLNRMPYRWVYFIYDIHTMLKIYF